MYWKELSNAQHEHEIIRDSLKQYEEMLQKQAQNRQPKYEVESYNLYLKVVQTFHQSVSGANYHVLEDLVEPSEPQNIRRYEFEHRKNIENFKPSLFEKVFRKHDSRMEQLVEALPRAIEADEKQYMRAIGIYAADKEIYTELIECMKGIMKHDFYAYEYWLEKSHPFEELEKYQIDVEYVQSGDDLELFIKHNHRNIVPMIEKSLVDNQVVAKPMNEKNRREILKHVITSVSVRCAREIFEALPINRAKIKSYVFYEEEPVLAVVYTKELFERLDFSCEDPKEIIELFNYLSQLDKV